MCIDEVYGVNIGMLGFHIFNDIEELIKSNANLTFEANAHQGELNITSDGSYSFINNDPPCNNELTTIDIFLNVDSGEVKFGGKFNKIQTYLTGKFGKEGGVYDIFMETLHIIDKIKSEYVWVSIDNRDY